MVSLSYFLALAIVCSVLFAFTYYLPKPENSNKAQSTFYFRLLLLFTIAAFAALLLQYAYFPLLAVMISNFFALMITYTLMFAIYTRYDCEISHRHILVSLIHSCILLSLIYWYQKIDGSNATRAILVFINACIPFILTIRKCHQQFKKHRLGDRVLYSSLLAIFTIFIGYITCYILFFSAEKKMPLGFYFIVLLSFICILFFGFALSIIYSLVGKLRKELITDRLTGAKNRNYLNDISQKLFSLAKRRNSPLSLILCDIDRFKNINDSYGHLAGDKVLISFSDAVEKILRAEDVFIRIGGEEFVILLPYNDLTQALATAERLRIAINALPISVDIDSINISASFGVTQVNTNLGIDNNINNADTALYEAKRGGRNKVVAYQA